MLNNNLFIIIGKIYYLRGETTFHLRVLNCAQVQVISLKSQTVITIKQKGQRLSVTQKLQKMSYVNLALFTE